MKTLLIIFLLLALCGVAYFTRPSEADFQAYVKNQLPDKPRGFWEKVLNRKPESQQFLDGCQFKDRYLWVRVEKDGEVIYTGAFDHFFAHGNPIPKVNRNDMQPPKDERSAVTQVE